MCTACGLAPAIAYKTEMFAADKTAVIAADDTPAPPAGEKGDPTDLTRIMLSRRSAAIDAAKRQVAAEVEAFLREQARQDKELDDWLAKEQAKLGKRK
jgi:hypothetical protein